MMLHLRTSRLSLKHHVRITSELALKSISEVQTLLVRIVFVVSVVVVIEFFFVVFNTRTSNRYHELPLRVSLQRG